jgi:hypothetical protein
VTALGCPARWLGTRARSSADWGCICLFPLACHTPQFARLPNLQHLRLDIANLPADDLLRLRGITYLHVQMEPPPALADMTQLRHLHLNPLGNRQEIVPQLDAALRHLQQLTALVLNGRQLLAIPPAAGGLRSLQRCMLGACKGHPLIGSLPAGPWMRSLRWLCADWEVLCSSPILATAENLEYICVGSMPRAYGALPLHSAAFFFWAAAHPPLRRLSLQTYFEPLPPEVFDAAKKLRDARPLLIVNCIGGSEHAPFSEELCQP